jgi:hypothetical protein
LEAIVKITAVLADAVAVAEGKLYVHGGGWHLVQSAHLPAVIPNLGVGIIIDFAPGELSRLHRFALRIRDAGGQLVPLAHDKGDNDQDTKESDEIVGEFSTAEPGDDAVVAGAALAFAFNIQRVTLDQDTRYELEIAIDEEVRERLRLEVQLVQPDTD